MVGRCRGLLFPVGEGLVSFRILECVGLGARWKGLYCVIGCGRVLEKMAGQGRSRKCVTRAQLVWGQGQESCDGRSWGGAARDGCSRKLADGGRMPSTAMYGVEVDLSY